MYDEQKLVTFMKKHGVEKEVALQYLTTNSWALDEASFSYESDHKDSIGSTCGGKSTTENDQEAYFAGKSFNKTDSTPALTTNDSDRSLRAWGLGVRLASAHPINPPPAQDLDHDSDSEPTDTEHTLVVLHLWSEGFSLDDGSLRLYEVPENDRFLRAILRGEFPQEMHELGNRLELSVQDHTNERFRHLSRKQFIGSGRLLGSPTPHLELQPEQTPIQRAERALLLNENAAWTTIQFRLADGSQESGRFNLTHTMVDLYRFVRMVRPQYSSQNFILMTTFPRQELEEHDPRTLAEVDLLNVVVIHHIKEELGQSSDNLSHNS